MPPPAAVLASRLQIVAVIVWVSLFMLTSHDARWTPSSPACAPKPMGPPGKGRRPILPDPGRGMPSYHGGQNP